jgi:hypothetical protein
MTVPRNEPGKRLSTIWIPDWTVLVIMVIAAIFIMSALSMNLNARRFPLLAGGLCLALGVRERLRDFVRHRTELVRGEPRVRKVVNWDDRKEIAIITVWLFGSVLSIYVLGILGTAFVSTAVYHKVIDQRSTALSLALGAAISIFLWLSFSYLAGFRLYEGMLPISKFIRL